MKNRILFISLAVVLALSVGLVGCTEEVGPEPEEEPYGTLTVALNSFYEETFLPWNGSSMRTSYLSLIYEFPNYLDPETQEFIPGLITDWEMSSDAMTYTLWVREGVQFHDGWGEVTAEDIKYSIEMQIDPDAIVGGASIFRQYVDSIETPETYKVVIHLNTPNPVLFNVYCSDSGGGLWIVSKDYCESVGLEEANNNPIGTGPYKLVDYKPGSSIELEVVADEHWRIGTPAFERIKFLLVPEEATRVAMLSAGEIDLAPISFDSIDTIEDIDGLGIFTIPNSWSPYCVFGGAMETMPERWNPENPWCDTSTVEYKGETYTAGQLVRKALNYAVDKRTIADTIFNGYAVAAAWQSPAPMYLAPDIPYPAPYPYDPLEALDLLEAAGYGDGFEVLMYTFSTAPGAELPDFGLAVASYWGDLGIDVEVQQVEYSAVVRPAWIAGELLDEIWTHRGMVRMDEALFGLTTGTRFTVFATEESEALWAEQDAELDPEEREELAWEFVKLIQDEAGFLFGLFADEPWGGNAETVDEWPTISWAPTNFDQISRP